MTECFICGRTNCFFKNVECLDYCCDCFEKLCCQECNRGYDSCIHFHKQLCDCTQYKVEYDWGGDLMFCIQCFEKKDPLTNLYKYFKNKYNETMSLEEIEKIMYKA